ncbi:MAG: recombinase RecT [Planctomycetota bacterium]|nr:MAG: recombinase RecT [Planctomycetota bacterium]
MENGQIQKSPVGQIRDYIANPGVKERLEQMLGKRADAFANSIINVVKGSYQLQKCTPESVMSAAMIAATMNLPIDPSLGFAAVVPYGQSAQFQLMYRGLTQLCIRSGKYARIHDTEVYKDEIEYHNPITGEVKFNAPETFKMRYSGKVEKISDVCGFYANFKLLSGFEKELFMTMEEVMSHAKKFSKAYQYDLNKNKKSSVWSTDPVSMGRKTVLKSILSKYGIMSIEMQDALVADSVDTTFEQAHENAAENIENQTGSEVIDADFESQDENEQETANNGQPDFMNV